MHLIDKELGKRVNIHTFSNDESLISFNRIDNNNKKILGFLLLQGVRDNNLDLIRECISKGVDINFTDYDNRTALHIASDENNKYILDLLKKHNARDDIIDRWGNTVNY